MTREFVLLFIGRDQHVRLDAVEAILDYRLFRRSSPNQDFLEVARSEGRIQGRCIPHPASVVIAGERIILSAVSKSALARRAGEPPWSGKRTRSGAGLPTKAQLDA